MTTNRVLLGVAVGIAIYMGVSSFGLFSNLEGNGNLIKETRDLATFHAIEAGGAFNITVKQGTPQQVVVESDDNIVPIIITKVQNGELKIHTDNRMSSISPTKMNITIVVANIDELDISGASTVESVGLIKSNKMEIECSGASKATIHLNCMEVDIDFSGASKGVFQGSTTKLEIEASGASDIKCEKLIADHISADVSGASYISLSANKSLKINASGASEVEYISEGAKVTIETSGAASVKKK